MIHFKRIILSACSLMILLALQSCNKSDEESAREITIDILTSKTWVYSSVSTPPSSASTGTDWEDFTVSFTETNMTATGQYTGAQAVWPSGTYTVSEDGKSITREDGVVMSLNPINESNFTAIFTVPDGTEIGGRVAALGGEYTFNMK